jgi:hypothetical protein
MCLNRRLFFSGDKLREEQRRCSVQTFVGDVNDCKASENQMQCPGCCVSGVRGERERECNVAIGG